MRKRLVYTFIFVVLLMAIGVGFHFFSLYRQWSSPQALLGRAARAVQQDKLGEAELLAKSAIKADPKNVKARLQTADILTAIAIERGEDGSPAAVEQLVQAARLAADNAEVQTRVFRALLRLGRTEAALDHARKAVELGSNQLQALQLVTDAEMEAENWDAAEKLLDRFAAVSKAGSLTVFVRRMQVLERSGQTERQEALCAEFLRDFSTVPDLELRGLDPRLITIVAQTINRQIDLASTDQLVSQAVVGLKILHRFHENDLFENDQTPLIQLAHKLVAKAQQGKATPKALTELHVDFTKISRTLFEAESVKAELSPPFVLQVSQSALLANVPNFAVTVLPRAIQNRQKRGQTFPLTDPQRAAAVTILLAAGDRLIQSGQQNSLVDASDILRRHEPTTTVGELLAAMVYAARGNAEKTTEYLELASLDSSIDPILLRGIRCRCLQQAEEWKGLSAELLELQTLEISDQQRGLLQVLLGSGDRQRLIRVMALLQSGEKQAAEKELETLAGTGLYSLGALVRILFELSDGTLASAEGLLQKYRESGATGTELAIAEATMMSASGQTDRIGKTLSQHLNQTPSNDRIRLLLARWHLSLGRHEEALTYYRTVMQTSPENLHAWKMTAVLLEERGRKSELQELFSRMRKTRAVASMAVRLHKRVKEFAKQLQSAKSGIGEGVQLVDLIPDDSSQASRDWRLMASALQTSTARTPERVLEQFRVALQRTDEEFANVDARGELQERILKAVASVSQADEAQMGERIEKLLQEFPKEPGVRLAAVVHHARRNDIPSAWKHAQELAKIDREPGRPEFWLARLLAVSYRMEEAAQQVEASLKLADQAEVRMFGAKLELFRHQPRQALEHLDRLPESMIQDVDPGLLRSEAYLQMGREKNAAAVLGDLVNRHPDRVDLWIALSDRYELQYGGEEAIAIAKQAWTRHPENVAVRSHLLSLLVRHDRAAEASSLAGQLVGANPAPQTAL